jgi:hypothetical protein
MLINLEFEVWMVEYLLIRTKVYLETVFKTNT